jgi:hypothetical protein
MGKRLEYAKIILREDMIKVEIRDGSKIVERSPECFPTQQLADKWIAERKAAEKIDEQQETGDK